MNELISLEKIAQWQKLKTLVLDSVSSQITKRVYNMALDEFMGWFQQAPRAGFTKATVSAWRVWDQLTTWEQETFIRTLIAQVRYDGGTGEVTVGFHSEGIKQLCAKQTTDEPK